MKRFDNNWTYGLPELYDGVRDRLRKSNKISNPGCYATGSQIGLYPLVEFGLLDPNIPPVVVGISGYSGAGTKVSVRNHPDTLKDNIVPYTLTGKYSFTI